MASENSSGDMTSPIVGFIIAARNALSETGRPELMIIAGDRSNFLRRPVSLNAAVMIPVFPHELRPRTMPSGRYSWTGFMLLSMCVRMTTMQAEIDVYSDVGAPFGVMARVIDCIKRSAHDNFDPVRVHSRVKYAAASLRMFMGMGLVMRSLSALISLLMTVWFAPDMPPDESTLTYAAQFVVMIDEVYAIVFLMISVSYVMIAGFALYISNRDASGSHWVIPAAMMCSRGLTK